MLHEIRLEVLLLVTLSRFELFAESSLVEDGVLSIITAFDSVLGMLELTVRSDRP